MVFYADIVASTLFMLSRWEESVVSERDSHGRFLAQRSVAFRQGFLDRPIVDEYALVLRAWIEAIAPWTTFVRRRFSVKLSHDVDHVQIVDSEHRGGHTYDVQALAEPYAGLQHMCWARSDPHLRGCYQLADISDKYGFKSAFYIKSCRARLHG